MKQINIGILAHVDAGKTTLSEAMLYKTGSLRKLGRVDKGDAFLDTDNLEKKRGITIFSLPSSSSLSIPFASLPSPNLCQSSHNIMMTYF